MEQARTARLGFRAKWYVFVVIC